MGTTKIWKNEENMLNIKQLSFISQVSLVILRAILVVVYVIDDELFEQLPSDLIMGV